MKEKKILKIILAVIMVVIVLFLLNTLRKFVIIKNLQGAAEKYASSNNVHVKSVEEENSNTIVTINYYKKAEKNLLTIERKNKDAVSKISKYSDGNKTDVYYDSADNKIAELNASESAVEFNIDSYVKTNNNWETFLASMSAKIKATQYNGKKCYVIKNFASSTFLTSKGAEAYIEKDTGLLVKYSMNSNTTERKYEFNNVSDSIFIEPDISEYKVK